MAQTGRLRHTSAFYTHLPFHFSLFTFHFSLFTSAFCLLILPFHPAGTSAFDKFFYLINTNEIKITRNRMFEA